ncbi:MAG: 50S ribosomal protein L25 [Elusimicrobiota bacterium]
MAEILLKASTRELTTKGGLRQMRLQGEIPAILYGGEAAPQNLAVNSIEFMKLRRTTSGNALIKLNISEKESKIVLVKDIQRHPTTEKVVHIDFYEVSMKKELELEVPIKALGATDTPGLKEGGVLEQVLWHLKIKCLPTNIPDQIEVDISQMKINDTIHVSDLKIPEGVKVLIEPEQTVIHIVLPKVEEPTPEEVAAAAAAAPAEPEVIGKGKKEEEGVEGEEAATPAAGAAAKGAAGDKVAKDKPKEKAPAEDKKAK